MDLGQRLRLLLAILVFLVLGALLFAFVVTALAVLLVVGAVLAILFYVRFRLFARKVRRELEKQMAQGEAPRPPPPAGVVDADFKVEK